MNFYLDYNNYAILWQLHIDHPNNFAERDITTYIPKK